MFASVQISTMMTTFSPLGLVLSHSPGTLLLSVAFVISSLVTMLIWFRSKTRLQVSSLTQPTGMTDTRNRRQRPVRS